VLLMVFWSVKSPAFFRGETLHRERTHRPERPKD
jgi:hypothetical protein